MAITERQLQEIEAQADATVPYYVPALIAEVRRLQQQAEGQPVLKTEWQRLESARDAALAERDVLKVQCVAKQRVVELTLDEQARLRAALTKARRVLREVEWDGQLVDDGYEVHRTCPVCNMANKHDANCTLAAVLAQDADA